LTHGLKRAGVPVVAGIDVDPICKFPFEKNNCAKFIHRDVSEVSAEEVAKLFPPSNSRVLVGCAPCSPFSRYARGNRTNDQQRWGLLSHFARLVTAIRPEIVSMENVPELHSEGIFRDFVNQLRTAGYKVNFSNVFCPDYGVPQQRTRLVLLASLYGSLEIGPPTHLGRYRTVREAISGLPRIRAGRTSLMDPLHRSSRLTGINLQRIQHSRPGGCWRDWPEQLVAKCHSLESGKTYPSVYGRMEWDKPAPTITTQFFGYGNGRFGHPTQDRAISLREGAILQSFPPGYKFFPPSAPLSFAALGRLIGNAVPVRLGEIIGRAIVKHVETCGQ
jgi:DNA (cytosine-5)-methyltransferase 1